MISIWRLKIKIYLALSWFNVSRLQNFQWTLCAFAYSRTRCMLICSAKKTKKKKNNHLSSASWCMVFVLGLLLWQASKHTCSMSNAQCVRSHLNRTNCFFFSFQQTKESFSFYYCNSSQFKCVIFPFGAPITSTFAKIFPKNWTEFLKHHMSSIIGLMSDFNSS